MSAMAEAIQDKIDRQTIVRSGNPTLEERVAELERKLAFVDISLWAQRVPTFAEIKDAVCTAFELSPADLHSKSFSQRVVLPRQVAMFLMRELQRASFQAIGGTFGKNHATVISSIRVISDRMCTEPLLWGRVQALRKKLST